MEIIVFSVTNPDLVSNLEKIVPIMRKLVAEIHFSSPFSSDFQVKSISAFQVKTLEVWAEKFI